jgi:hypothetical protein
VVEALALSRPDVGVYAKLALLRCSLITRFSNVCRNGWQTLVL